MSGLLGALIGAVVALFGIYIAQSNGLLLYWVAKEEHDLNLRKAAPALDSSVRITERQINPVGYDPFYYIVITIYNHGDLAATQLNGHWRMYSPRQMIQEYNVPIRRDALGALPNEFEPYRIIGPGIEAAIRRHAENVSINVDIEFDYFGFSPEEPQHYAAQWQYDHHNGQMIRI